MEKILAFRERSLTIKNIAAFSGQHAEMALALLKLARIPCPTSLREKMTLAEQSFREVRNNAEILYRKKLIVETDKPTQTDLVLLRNVIASFNRLSLDFIDEMSNLCKEEAYEPLAVFFRHFAAESKMYLEMAYPLSF